MQLRCASEMRVVLVINYGYCDVRLRRCGERCGAEVRGAGRAKGLEMNRLGQTRCVVSECLDFSAKPA